MSPECLWIGLVELKPLDSDAYGAAGAFTNVLAWARDPEGFRLKADLLASSLAMYVLDVEEAEPLSERAAHFALTEEVEDMVLRAQSDQSAVVHGTFHQYPFDEG